MSSAQVLAILKAPPQPVSASTSSGEYALTVPTTCRGLSASSAPRRRAPAESNLVLFMEGMLMGDLSPHYPPPWVAQLKRSRSAAGGDQRAPSRSAKLTVLAAATVVSAGPLRVA